MTTEQLRKAQDTVIAIAERRGFPFDVPISSLQVAAPTVNELRKNIWPDFVPCIESFLAEYDRN